MNDIRLIAMDLDGTLLQKDNCILPETLKALQAAIDKGVAVTLASGRYAENAGLTLIDNELQGYVIGSNGGVIQDAPMGQTLFLHTIERKTASRVRQCLDDMNAKYILFCYKLVATSAVGLSHRSEINDGNRIGHLGKVRFEHGHDAVEEALRLGICKFFIPDQPDLESFGPELRKIPNLLVTRSNEHNIELMPEGIHKGYGIAELARWLGIPLSSVMAFGDEENDLPMLTSVGYGFAMGNAPEHVKAQCAFATDSFDNNGIAHAIEKYVLS